MLPSMRRFGGFEAGSKGKGEGEKEGVARSFLSTNFSKPHKRLVEQKLGRLAT